eukprot:13911932-Alexandrium_andersonii.AAC.1
MKLLGGPCASGCLLTFEIRPDSPQGPPAGPCLRPDSDSAQRPAQKTPLQSSGARVWGLEFGHGRKFTPFKYLVA